jgi:hypothetical protein
MVDDQGLTTILYKEYFSIALHTLRFHDCIYVIAHKEPWFTKASATLRVMKNLIKLLKLNLSIKARVNQSPKFEFKFKGRDWKFWSAGNMAMMANSRVFGNLQKSILSMIPKDDLSIMIFSLIKQFHKNNWCQEAIVSRVVKQLIDIIFWILLEKFLESA